MKFQTHIAAAESTPGEPWRVRFSYQDASRYEYWKRMEFTEEQWLGLKRHAEEKGLEFLSSPFSIEAAKMLQRIGVRAWKVASGEISNAPLFDFIIGTRLPMMVSTGMSSIEETDVAVARLQGAGIPVAVTQCTSMYPCPPEKIGLNMIPYYRQRYGCAVGLSDHSGTIFPGLAAAALGIEVLEIHVVLQPGMLRSGRGGFGDKRRAKDTCRRRSLYRAHEDPRRQQRRSGSRNGAGAKPLYQEHRGGSRHSSRGCAHFGMPQP